MLTIEQEMQGKVAIITGGNTGIGLGCAQVFCAAGMNVVIAARRAELGEKAAREVSMQESGMCIFKKCNVSDPEEVKDLVDFAVETYGKLDAMVNNAGYAPAHVDACEMPTDSYLDVLNVNLAGVFYGCKYAIPHLRKTKGSIINMSSVLAEVGQEQTAGYSATKGGICSMTKTIAIEEARYGVRINAIMPGHIITELFESVKAGVHDPEAYEQRCNSYSWLGRGGTPLEVGQTALFLASSWAGFITGTSIMVSGGTELGTIPKAYHFDI